MLSLRTSSEIAVWWLAIGSMGVGRTGVFIALSIALERMRFEGVVDMFQTVRLLRTQRPAMVQTEVCRLPLKLISFVAIISYQFVTAQASLCIFHSVQLNTKSCLT